MRVLSIDPGYERLGVAILDKVRGGKEQLVFSDCVKTSAELTFEDRLLILGQKVEELIATHSPQALSIENLFISNNQKTAMRVSEVRGAILYIAKKYNLVIREFTPLQIKLSVTGDGKSTKDQVIKMVGLIIPAALNKKALDDEYDAIAVGIAFFAYERGL
jgi:crossover junction endodeoxyribonuclease RuvC